MLPGGRLLMLILALILAVAVAVTVLIIVALRLATMRHAFIIVAVAKVVPYASTPSVASRVPVWHGKNHRRRKEGEGRENKVQMTRSLQAAGLFVDRGLVGSARRGGANVREMRLPVTQAGKAGIEQCTLPSSKPVTGLRSGEWLSDSS